MVIVWYTQENLGWLFTIGFLKDLRTMFGCNDVFVRNIV